MKKPTDLDLHCLSFNILISGSEPKSSEPCFNKSAVTDHIAKANHVVDWEGAKIVDRENNQTSKKLSGSASLNTS